MQSMLCQLLTTLDFCTAQLAANKQRTEKRVGILEDNLHNAEAEVDELDEMLTNCYGILAKHPRVLQENTSLQLLFNALERNDKN